jgi:hypothetical protein
MSKTCPTVPDSLPIREALAQSEPMLLLQARIRDSRRRLECILTVLPSSVRPLVQAGPLDESGWTLLAANAAAASKLRHLEPLIQDRLRANGWNLSAIRIKVQAVKTA